MVGAADQAAKVFVAQPDAASGRAAAEQAVLLALADYGHAAANARVETSCVPADCMAAGSAVTVTVHLTVPLPFVPVQRRPRPERRPAQRLGHPDGRAASGDGAAPPRSPAARTEDGQLMVLIIGYVLLALLVATVVAAASSVYIEHKKLLSLADGASVAAADSFTLGQLRKRRRKPHRRPQTGARVRSAAVDYLNRNGAFARFSGLAVGPGTGSPDGSTAVVVLSAAVHPPVVNFLVPDGIRIEATLDGAVPADALTPAARAPAARPGRARNRVRAARSG